MYWAHFLQISSNSSSACTSASTRPHSPLLLCGSLRHSLLSPLSPRSLSFLLVPYRAVVTMMPNKPGAGEPAQTCAGAPSSASVNSATRITLAIYCLAAFLCCILVPWRFALRWSVEAFRQQETYFVGYRPF